MFQARESNDYLEEEIYMNSNIFFFFMINMLFLKTRIIINNCSFAKRFLNDERIIQVANYIYYDNDNN